MKKKSKTLVIVVLVFLSFQTLAQKATVSTGGDAMGGGGSVSYTVGQTLYNVNSGQNESVWQGVQQPYEISEVTAIEDVKIDFDINVYPNPTSEFIVLNVGKSEGLTYQLFDVLGKVIMSDKLRENSIVIEMRELPSAIYFVRIIKENKIVKTFKIIKNN